MRISLTRQDLYARVWSEPVQKLSQQLGISDRGLAKLCGRYDIPVPPRGFWAKKAAGKTVAQVPLPEAPRGLATRIDFSGPANRPPAEGAGPVHPLIAAESDPANAITVSDHLKIRHPLLLHMREFWRHSRQPYWNQQGPVPPRLEISVGRDQQSRALRLLQALFDALVRRGFAVSRADDGRIAVGVLDETCHLSLRERQQQVRAEQPASSAATSLSGPRVQLLGKGELEFRIERTFNRRTIADGKRGRLEERLNEVVVAVLEAAFAEKANRAAREADRRAEEERQRRTEEARERARQERARVAYFDQLAAAADRHLRLRDFAAALRAAAGQVPEESGLSRWLKWVDGHVAANDVLQRFREHRQELQLHFCADSYDAPGILSHGFAEAKPAYGDDQELPSAVLLTDVPMERVYGGSVVVVVTLPEGEALPFERLGGHHGYRTFRMPASVVNQFPRALRDG